MEWMIGMIYYDQFTELTIYKYLYACKHINVCIHRIRYLYLLFVGWFHRIRYYYKLNILGYLQD